MSIPQTVRGLFAPLGKRLYYYESDYYLQDDFSFEGTGFNTSDFPYEDMIEKIGRDVNSYNPTEVISVADEYIDRIIRIYGTLRNKETQIKSSSIGRTEVPVPLNRQKKMRREWESELEFYLEHLKAIWEPRVNFLKNTSLELKPPIEIILSNDFRLTAFEGVFQPRISIKQAALFLYFLRLQKYIPDYSDKALGEFAKLFFARNDQNVRASLSNIKATYTDNKELNKLKGFLSGLLDEVDSAFKAS